MLLFLAMGVGLLAAWLVVQALRPLFERGVVTADDWSHMEDESAALLNRRDRLVSELREIEFEAALHKIDARDLEALRARYEAEALAVMNRLDERAEAYETRIDADVNATLEAARAKREGRAPATPATPATPEAPPAAPEAAPEAPPAPVDDPVVPPPAEPEGPDCVACGETLEPDAAFCDHCGAAQGQACPDCERRNRPGARFCKGCGAALEHAS